MKEFIIGIDFGKTNVRYAICEDKPELKYYTKEPYGRGSAEEMHQQIFAGVDKCIAESGYDKKGRLVRRIYGRFLAPVVPRGCDIGPIPAF